MQLKKISSEKFNSAIGIIRGPSGKFNELKVFIRENSDECVEVTASDKKELYAIGREAKSEAKRRGKTIKIKYTPDNKVLIWVMPDQIRPKKP